MMEITELLYGDLRAGDRYRCWCCGEMSTIQATVDHPDGTRTINIVNDDRPEITRWKGPYHADVPLAGTIYREEVSVGSANA
jgi:hypothetical protein